MNNVENCIRWLHMSDFHVGKDDYASEKMFQYILEHVKRQKAAGIVPDFIFLTGDIANRAKVSEYEAFWLNFLVPLQESIGGNIAQRTFIVPGNHDVERDVHTAFSREEMTKVDSQYFDPTEAGKKNRNMILPRFKNYIDNDMTESKAALGSLEGSFSKSVTIHGLDIGIVGMNTAWLCKGEGDRGALTIGKPLLEKSLETASKCRYKIVLGHHPLDWLREAEQKSVTSLLAKYNAIYMHGHMHTAWAGPSYGTGNEFLTIQAGAAFQAREGDKWRNGLLWGELHPEDEQICLQPWHWKSDEQNWKPDGDALPESHRDGVWWHYQCPSPYVQAIRVSTKHASAMVRPAPAGWTVVKPEGLEQYKVPLEKQQALLFFDGAVPDWPIAVSASVPRRLIVERLVASFGGDLEKTTQSRVTLLLAGGCEGKTTAILQSALEIVQGGGWLIMQRRDESQLIVGKELLAALNPDYKNLILIDEADNVAALLAEFLSDLPAEFDGKIHCLLACRDTDWRSSAASEVRWPGRVSFHQDYLLGLDGCDAENIVSAWAAYGAEGLGDLATIPSNERAAKLSREAHNQSPNGVGAFFGALLMVRSAQHLREHAITMLNRMKSSPIPGGRTLYDALMMVAIMHATGLELLSRSVLAEALGCPIEKLQRHVLLPLGREAAATTTSSFILTRHAEIAKTLFSVLETEFGESLGAAYAELAKTAILTSKKNLHVPKLVTWRFELIGHFYEMGWHELALSVGLAILAVEPENSNVRSHVASFHRKAGQVEDSINIFTSVSSVVQNNRGFYYEWGIAESEIGNMANNVLLAAYSLSDQCAQAFVNNDQAMKSLNGMGMAFANLFESYNDLVFRDARMSIAVLGQTLRLDVVGEANFKFHMSQSLVKGVVKPNLTHAIRIIKNAIMSANDMAQMSEVPHVLPDMSTWTFMGLERLVESSQASRSK